ncbi:MAG TPA: hypothetical protein VFH27_16820 [Longimicrobiaceae bacterium]|nr:hypothetical protein [Longimicrobiaceae bacterium]
MEVVNRGPRIDRLTAPPDVPDLVHVRVWIPGSWSPRRLLDRLVNVDGRRGAVLVELWGPSSALRDSISRDASPVTCSLAGVELFTMQVSALSRHVDVLVPEPFAIWCGADVRELAAAACAGTVAQKCSLLPAGGMWVISSLYDENVEIYSRGRSYDELAVLSG